MPTQEQQKQQKRDRTIYLCVWAWWYSDIRHIAGKRIRTLLGANWWRDLDLRERRAWLTVSRGSGSGRGRGRGLDRTSSSSSSSSISPLSGHLRRQRQQQQHTPAATEAQAGERGRARAREDRSKKKCSTTTNWGMRYTGKYKHCIVDLKIDLNLILWTIALILCYLLNANQSPPHEYTQQLAPTVGPNLTSHLGASASISGYLT